MTITVKDVALAIAKMNEIAPDRWPERSETSQAATVVWVTERIAAYRSGLTPEDLSAAIDSILLNMAPPRDEVFERFTMVPAALIVKETFRQGMMRLKDERETKARVSWASYELDEPLGER